MLKKHSPELLREFMVELGLRRPVAQALLSLGICDGARAREFLSPAFADWSKPRPFPALDKAARLVADQILGGGTLCVHGDFDADGVLGTVIVKEFIESVGGNCTAFIPPRELGHGFSVASLREISDRGIGLLITVDSGTTAIEAVARAVELGIAVVISDHHLPGDTLPDAAALVNPHVGGPAAYQSDCGAAVALRLCLATAALLPGGRVAGEKFELFLRNALVLASIATIADVMPLKADNRTLVKQGLAIFDKADMPTLSGLVRTSGLRSPIKAEDLAFQLIPRMNAAQRMGQPELLWKLFSSRNVEEANETSHQLDRLNEERRVLQDRYSRSIISRLEEEHGQSSPPAIVVSGDEWIEGLSGLIASRVKERFGVPVAVLLNKDGQVRASLRAPEGYHIVRALETMPELLGEYGGHAGAAGFSISEENIESFSSRFIGEMEGQSREMPGEGSFMKI
ncbi:MAG: DHH family phosphoesterase, partial [Planctomycetes bacterium]|nr:DHH family phosphoesterase [Planctomycetota bacterium]